MKLLVTVDIPNSILCCTCRFVSSTDTGPECTLFNEYLEWADWATKRNTPRAILRCKKCISTEDSTQRIISALEALKEIDI